MRERHACVSSGPRTWAVTRLLEMVRLRTCLARASRRPRANVGAIRSASNIATNGAENRSVTDGLRVQPRQVAQLVGGQCGQPALAGADDPLGEHALVGDEAVDALLQ